MTDVSEMNDMTLAWELACANQGVTRTPADRHADLRAEWDRRGLDFEDVANQIARARIS